MRVVAWLITCILLALSPMPTGAQTPPGGTVKRPTESNGTVIVPDRFLRRWDPVTVFFDHGVGIGKSVHDAGVLHV